MSNKFFSFYYDPVRQGYDTNTWTTLAGVPAVSSGKLELDSAEIIHFADLLRGDATLNISLPAPTAGDATKFGFYEPNKAEFAYFDITDDVFSAQTSDGITPSSVEIAWETAWSDSYTNFRIKWEAGAVRFYVNDGLMATIDQSSTLGVSDTVVPNDPMSIYLLGGSSTPLLLNFFEVKGIESSNLVV